MAWNRALVTGASSGIGEEFARTLASRGTDLVLVARRRDRLQALADRLPVGCEVLDADLASDAGVDRVVDRLGAGDVDLLVNNAGFGTSGALAEVDPGVIADEVRVNCLALLRLSRAAIDQMVERRRGGILNVASVVAFQPAPYMATYAGTKAFVLAFTESVAEEVAGTGVRVQALCPGLTRTEFQDVAGYENSLAPGWMWQSAEEVVETSLAAMDRGRVVVIPGAHNRVAMGASGLLPRLARRKIAGIVQQRARHGS
jgi:short-subunit dehydrogenase